MSVSSEYKRQTDAFCERGCSVTAQDILSRANSSDKIIPIERGRRRVRLSAVIAAAAACFLLLGATALGVTGTWGDIIRALFGDETTADIADKGYIYEIAQRGTDGVFTVDLKAVTGDAATPKLLFDVYISDEEITAANDRIQLYAYVLSEEVYNSDIESYGPCDAYGERDDKVQGLYHVIMDGPSVWLTGSEPVVVDVCNVITELSYDIPTWHDTDIRFDITPAAGRFHPVTERSYSGIVFSSGGIDYRLRSVIAGEYRLEMNFIYDYIGTPFAGDEADYSVLEQRLHENWKGLAERMVVEADGVHYTVPENEIGYTWCDTLGESGAAYRCYVVPQIPDFDFAGADEIIISVDDVSYKLK